MTSETESDYLQAQSWRSLEGKAGIWSLRPDEFSNLCTLGVTLTQAKVLNAEAERASQARQWYGETHHPSCCEMRNWGKEWSEVIRYVVLGACPAGLRRGRPAVIPNESHGRAYRREGA